ncbi:MAG: heparinase II/III family protein [Bacteroidales bacterium]|nr:heparinase II/III family protein [Bacteroidales bacterium]
MVVSESFNKYFCGALFILCLAPGLRHPVYAGEDNQNQKNTVICQDINKLLLSLDLNAPGLEKVKSSVDDPVLAAKELLAYYRARDFVRHPVDRRSKQDMSGKCASRQDISEAENAMKHIFIGQSAYPPHFCGEDINWNTRPVPDMEWVWQLNRMGFWQSMSLAYWHTNDEKYAKEWSCQFVDWTKKNPRDNEHGYAWRSIEAGIRGHGWTFLFQRFLDAPSFTPEVLVAFLNCCHEHAAYLMTKYSKGSNWGLMEAEGLAFIAITFPEFQDSKKWRDEAILRLNTEINNQVYSDGHQRELAMGYHTGCIGWFTHSLELAKMNGQKDAFPDSYLKTVEKVCEIPLKLGFPDGTTPQFGDSWTGTPGHIWGSLRNWAQLYNRDDFLYVATQGKEGSKPDVTAFALEKSGFYSMRSGWDRNSICLVLKCGPDGGGHCQPDNGTFELYAGGRHLMPDAGSYIYSGDPKNRAWFRQTKVHQTLTLDGKNSAYSPKLLLWKPGTDLDVLVVENASYQSLTHRRAVLFVDKKYFVIIDEAIGDGTGAVDIHFQLGPGKAVFDNKNFSVRTDTPGGWNVLVQSMKQKGMDLKEEEGQVSFLYTKKEPRPAFSYGLQKNTKEHGTRFVTIVAPYEESQPKMKIRLIGKPKIGASHMELEIVADGISKRIKYDL